MNKLVIRGPQAAIERLLANLARVDAAGWRRDEQAEARLAQRQPWRSANMCLTRASRSGGRQQVLWVLPIRPDEVFVENCSDRRESDERQYDAILTEFASAVLGPATAGLGLEIHEQRVPSAFESQLSPEAMRRLEALALMGGYAGDQEALAPFVIQIRLDDELPDPAAIERWLAEHGWAAQDRQALVKDFEAMQSFLISYDQERVKACPR